MALATAGAVAVLSGTLMAFPAAGSAASSAYAVTEVPFSPASAYDVVADSDTSTVYAATSAPALAVIDPATNSVTAQISLPETPSSVAVDSASDTVYVLGTSSLPSPENPDAVYVISGATNAVTNTIPLSFRGGVIAVNPDTDMIYVTVPNGAVVVINGSTDAVATTISLADPVLDPAPAPQQLVVDTATDTIYVSDAPLSGGSDQVEVIDGMTNAVTARIALPSIAPSAMTVDPAAGLLYVPESDAIAVVDTATDGVSTLTSGVEAGALTLDAAAGTLYATTYYGGADGLGLGDTFVIGTATGAIEAEIPRGGSSLAIPASGGSVYVAGGSSAGELGDDVTVITPSTVNTMSPVILNSGLNCTVGQACQAQLLASGVPAATFSGAAGLPAWLTVSSTGLLSGTPPAGTGGTYTVPVTATNGIAPADTAAISTTVDEAPAITSPVQATFHVGVAGTFTLNVTGYPGSSWYETGALPAGVTFNETGVLSGAPAVGTEGSYPIQFEAFNDVGTPAFQSFTLIVDDQPAAVAVGVEGSDGELWVQSPQLGSGWYALGGQIIAPPAVAAPPNPGGATPVEPLFVGTGSNGELWIRSLTDGWQAVGPSEAFCIGAPAAVVSGTTLTVACRGLDSALWINSAALPSSGLPQFTQPWTSLGGVLSAGPAASVVPFGQDHVVTFFVIGTNGEVFINTGAGYFAPMSTPWFCLGSPAAAFEPVSGSTLFACTGVGDHQVWTSSNGGAAWALPEPEGGQLIGGPAIAATNAATPEIFAEGLDHAAWVHGSGGWSSLGGGIVGGIGAVVLE